MSLLLRRALSSLCLLSAASHLAGCGSEGAALPEEGQPSVRSAEEEPPWCGQVVAFLDQVAERNVATPQGGEAEIRRHHEGTASLVRRAAGIPDLPGGISKSLEDAAKVEQRLSEGPLTARDEELVQRAVEGNEVVMSQLKGECPRTLETAGG